MSTEFKLLQNMFRQISPGINGALEAIHDMNNLQPKLVQPWDHHRTWLDRGGLIEVQVEIMDITGGYPLDNSGPVPNEGYSEVKVELGRAKAVETCEAITLTQAEQEQVKREYIKEVCRE